MLRVWIEGMGLKAVPVRTGLSAEKNEVTEIKEKVSQLIGEGRLSEAMENYITALEDRLDMLLKEADLYGSMHRLTKIIEFIGENPESAAGYFGVRNFDELVSRAKKIRGYE
ncbi:MAG: hypothetical protein K5987_05420 [Lachnospiraceae bacterium]|nr:hypothetical protein [Lachnospiraceae bacterium]